MPRQDLGVVAQRQVGQQGQAFLHLAHAAAGHIGTPAGAGKQRITTEKQVATVQHHTALGMAGGVIDFKC